MRKRSCGRPLRCSPSACWALRQPQAVAAEPDTTALRNAVTRAEVLRYEQRLNAIGLSNENNRLTASQGNFESVNYVIGELRKMGYNPTLLPYANAQLAEHVVRARTTVPVLEQISPTPQDLRQQPEPHGRLRADDVGPHGRRHRAGDPGRRGSQIPPVGTAERQPRRLLDERLPGRGQGQHRAGPARRLHSPPPRRQGSSRRSINARAAGAKAVLIINEGQTEPHRPGHDDQRDDLHPRGRPDVPGHDGRDALLRRRQGALRRSPRPARPRRCTSRPTTTSRSGSTTTSSPRPPAAIRPACCRSAPTSTASPPARASTTTAPARR